MQLYILLLFELLLIFGSKESPNNHTNNYFNRNNGYNLQQQNSGYNEVNTIIPRNQRQHFNGDNENSHPTENTENSKDFSWGNVPSNSQPLKPSVPVAATLELPGSQKFSSLPSTINNIAISTANDKVIFPDDIRATFNELNFTKDEIACFVESKVFFHESCYKLKDKGPCGEGEWLILDLKATHRTPPKIVPKCSKRNCKSDEFFWAKTKKCYRYDDKTQISKICPPGNAAGEDYFGYGRCECDTLHGLHSNGTCYPLYSQGPCSKGYLFVESKSKVECIKNPCINSSLVFYDKDEKKKCYELGKQGPCEPNFIFQVSNTNKKPDCINNVVFLAVIKPPPTCATDANQQCKTEFKVEESKNYIDRIIAEANKRKGNT